MWGANGKVSGFRLAVAGVLDELGTDVLLRPHEFVGAVSDLYDPNSPEMMVLYVHCTEELLQPYVKAVEEGTSEALEHAALKVEYYLHDVRRVTATDARVVAQGISGGIADYLRTCPPNPQSGPQTGPQPGPQHGPAQEPPRRRYNVSFDANGGMGTPPGTRSCLSLDTVVLPGPGTLMRPGYKFSGWGKSRQAIVPWKPRSDYTVSSNTTFYALWEEEKPPEPPKPKYPPQKTVRLYFDANGGTGTVPAAMSCLCGEAVTLPGPGTLAREGYKFVGWGRAQNATSCLGAGLKFNVASNTTLYALWEAADHPKPKKVWLLAVLVAILAVVGIYFGTKKEPVTISASSSRVSLKEGESKEITYSLDGGLPDEYALLVSVNDSLYTTEWLDDEGTSQTLSITGAGEGTGHLSVVVADQRDLDKGKKFDPLAETEMSVTVIGPPRITASEKSVTVQKGKSYDIIITTGGDLPDDWFYSASGSTGYDTSWGDWNGSGKPLTITGTKTGSYTLTLSIKDGLVEDSDANTKVLATTEVKVKVT